MTDNSKEKAIQLFKKTYDGESLVDIGRDVFEAFDPRFNKTAEMLEQDDYGISSGEFIVTIEWVRS